MDPAGTVFVTLASLTGEPDAAPLGGLATAGVTGLVVTAYRPDGGRTEVAFGGYPTTVVEKAPDVT